MIPAGQVHLFSQGIFCKVVGVVRRIGLFWGANLIIVIDE